MLRKKINLFLIHYNIFISASLCYLATRTDASSIRFVSPVSEGPNIKKLHFITYIVFHNK